MTSFSISELAAEFDVTARTIRYYEDHGLLSPAREGPSGHKRVYSQRDRTRLRLTLRGKRLGLSLAEVRELVDMYETDADTRSQLTRFLEVLSQHKRRLNQQLQDLNETLEEITAQEVKVKELLARVRD